MNILDQLIQKSKDFLKKFPCFENYVELFNRNLRRGLFNLFIQGEHSGI